jgi:hypothetical protein
LIAAGPPRQGCGRRRCGDRASATKLPFDLDYRAFMAFSSEVETASREENASK